MYSAWFMCQRACEAIALRLKLLCAAVKHFAKILAGHDGAGSVETVLPQAAQRPQHLCAGFFNLQICVVYGVDELGATVRSDGKGQYASGLANLGAAHLTGQLHALAA